MTDRTLSEEITDGFKALETIRKQQEEIEYWKDKFNKAMQMQEPKPAKYTDAWWKEVEEFNKQLKEQEK
jgi:hypothetical protein